MSERGGSAAQQTEFGLSVRGETGGVACHVAEQVGGVSEGGGRGGGGGVLNFCVCVYVCVCVCVRERERSIVGGKTS